MASSVFSRVVWLGALTAAGQLLIIGSLPWYSQIFDPGTYGTYVIYLGLFTVLSVVAGVRYDSAIVLPRSDGIAAALSALVMTIALGIAGLVAAGTLLAVAAGWGPKHAPTVATHFGYGLAAATLVGAVQRCCSGWCIRERKFLSLGLGQFVFCLVSVAAQLAFARFMTQVAALVWGHVTALLVQTACISGSLLKSLRASTMPGSLRGMWFAARKYRRFPTYMVGYALASSARDRLIQLVLGLGAGAAAVGRFGLAYRVVFAPNSLVYSAISPVFFAIASRGNRLSVGRFAAHMVEVIFVVLVVPYTALAFEAPAMTDALLSPKWQGTGPYLQALAGPALLLAATCWLDRAFDSFRRQRVAFSLEATYTLISVSFVGLLSSLIAPVSAVWAFGALALLYYWIYFLATFVACGFPLADFRRVCLTGVLSSGAAVAFGAASHEIPVLLLRIPAYGAAMVVLIAGWIRFRGGADILRTLSRSQINGSATT